jgi:PilZ domain
MKERRQYFRFAVDDLDVQTSTVVSSEVEINDISPTGVSIICSRNLRVGREYTLRLEVEGNPPVAVRGVVKWEMLVGRKKVSGIGIGHLFLAGMELTDLLTAKMTRIVDFIKEIVDVKDKRLRGIRFKISTHQKGILDCVETYSVKLLSLSGMLIETKKALSVGKVFPMELLLPDDDRPIHFRGRIASRQDAMTGGVRHFRTGIEFSEMILGDKARLKAFLHLL